jgi:hypothetical protein
MDLQEIVLVNPVPNLVDPTSQSFSHSPYKEVVLAEPVITETNPQSMIGILKDIALQWRKLESAVRGWGSSPYHKVLVPSNGNFDLIKKADAAIGLYPGLSIEELKKLNERYDPALVEEGYLLVKAGKVGLKDRGLKKCMSELWSAFQKD